MLQEIVCVRKIKYLLVKRFFCKYDYHKKISIKIRKKMLNKYFLLNLTF